MFNQQVASELKGKELACFGTRQSSILVIGRTNSFYRGRALVMKRPAIFYTKDYDCLCRPEKQAIRSSVARPAEIESRQKHARQVLNYSDLGAKSVSLWCTGY